jgi:hypothetical protein
MGGTILLNGGIQHHTPTAASAPDALNDVLRDGLASIYGRFADAPISPSADELSKLLIADNLKGLTGAIETLELCKEQEGQWVIDPTRPALQEVFNRIKSKGPLTGKDLRDHFGAPPFGWTVDGVKFLVGALQRANLLKATHQAQSFVGSSDPKVKTWFVNNTAFNSTAFQLHEASLTTKDIVEASKLFTGFSGKKVQGVQVAPLARDIRDQARQLIAENDTTAVVVMNQAVDGYEAVTLLKLEVQVSGHAGAGRDAAVREPVGRPNIERKALCGELYCHCFLCCETGYEGGHKKRT